LPEAKSFDNFSLYSLLIAVAWGCGKADAKLIFDEVRKSLWRFEHDPVRLVNYDQRVLFWLKIAPYSIFNLIFASSQAPKVLKISSVSFH